MFSAWSAHDHQIIRKPHVLRQESLQNEQPHERQLQSDADFTSIVFVPGAMTMTDLE